MATFQIWKQNLQGQSIIQSFRNSWNKIKKEEKGKSSKNTVNHLQKAKEIGGTSSTAPLAIIRLLDIKKGCINKSKYGKKFELMLGFNLIL